MYDYAYSMSGALDKNGRDKIYIWLSETTNGSKYLVESNGIIYLSDTRWERGVIQSEIKITIRKK